MFVRPRFGRKQAVVFEGALFNALAMYTYVYALALFLKNPLFFFSMIIIENWSCNSDIRAVYMRENKPRLTLAAAYIRREHPVKMVRNRSSRLTSSAASSSRGLSYPRFFGLHLS